jgi:hypothetical protein
MDLILFPFSILIKRSSCVFGGKDMTLAELRKEPHLSSSSINDYVECGLLYKLGRIDHIPMEFRSDSLEFGSAVHLVLAAFYQERLIGNTLLLKDIHALFEHYWGRWQGSPEIAYARGKDFETLLMEGKELLSTWYDNPTLTPFLRKATKKRYFSWLYTRNLLILLEAAFEEPNVVPHNIILCLTRSFYVV